MSNENLEDHISKSNARRIGQISPRFGRGQFVGPQLGKGVHVRIKLHLILEVGHMEANLLEEFLCSEGHPRDGVATLGLLTPS